MNSGPVDPQGPFPIPGEGGFPLARPVRLRDALLLCALIGALALGLERVFYGSVFGAYGSHPHPYWLMPIVLAAAYGLVPGLIGALGAGALLLGGAWLRGHVPHPTALLDRDALSEPLLFFGVAALIGELRDLVQARLFALQESHRELLESHSRRQYECRLLRTTNAELERRVSQGDRDLQDLIHMAHRMRYADRRDLLGIAADLALQNVGDAVAAYEVGPDGSLTEWVQRTRGNHPCIPLETLRTSPLVQHCIEEGEVQNALEHRDVSAERDPLFVAPLFDHRRRIEALLVVHDLAPERLAPRTVRTFAAIADWVSAGLAHLAMGTPVEGPLEATDLEAHEQDHPHQIIDAPLLPGRLMVEFERHHGSDLPLSVLGLMIPDWQNGLDETWEARLLTGIAPALRAADGIYRFSFAGCFVLVLPATGSGGAGIVSARLRRSLGSLGSRFGVDAQLFQLGPDFAHADASAVLRELADRFRQMSAQPLGLAELPAPHQLRLGDSQEMEVWIARERSLQRRFGFQYQIFQVIPPETSITPPDALIRVLEGAINRGQLPRVRIFWTRGQPLFLGFAGTAAGRGNPLATLQTLVGQAYPERPARVVPYHADPVAQEKRQG
ncbi:MAG: hypothetical protein R3F17_10455 [Planctomycetota bacterium]